MTDVVIRPNAEQVNVDALRDAYTKMQALPGTDNRSWVYWAGVHGFPDYECWHHQRTGPGRGRLYPYDLFLPWHRAYLLAWDHQTRDQNPDAILPWWDWTSDESHAHGLPTPYAPESVNGDVNPLGSGPTPDMPGDPARRTRRFPGDPSQLPAQSDVDSLLQLPRFEDFSSQLQDVHDYIHGWVGGISPDDPNVGGDMGAIPTSAFDPIFFAHHAMIDRIWYLWQEQNGIANIPPNYLSLPVGRFGYTVSDLLDVRHLGYQYASSSTEGSPA